MCLSVSTAGDAMAVIVLLMFYVDVLSLVCHRGATDGCNALVSSYKSALYQNHRRNAELQVGGIPISA